MRLFLVLLALSGVFLFAGYERAQQDHEKFLAENRWIYGFGIRRGVPPFAGYLEQVTAEGLREIRWDHKPKAIVMESSYYTTSTVMTLSSTTGAWASCSTRPAMTIVTW